MKTLTLNLKRQYFDEIKRGVKKEEYRLVKPYWEKRLKDKSYDNILIKLGYPKPTEADKIIEVLWQGYTKKQITHTEFGPEPVWVFAIKLSD